MEVWVVQYYEKPFFLSIEKKTDGSIGEEETGQKSMKRSADYSECV